MSRPDRFAGRSVLVTGSTGMAADAARALATEGATLLIASRTEEHARRLAEELRARGARAEWRAADLTREDDADGAVAAAVGAFGRLDAVYAVAGGSARRFGDGPLDEMTLEGWEAAIAQNATSPFLVLRAAVRAMLAQEARPFQEGTRPGANPVPGAAPTPGTRGTILLMSSVLASHPAPTWFATHGYAAAKGAVEALVRTVAAAYAPAGIRVNAIAPALVATPMSVRALSDPRILTFLTGKQPLAAGPMTPADITDVALHLLSDEARMMSGQVVTVDGGWSVAEGPIVP